MSGREKDPGPVDLQSSHSVLPSLRDLWCHKNKEGVASISFWNLCVNPYRWHSIRVAIHASGQLYMGSWKEKNFKQENGKFVWIVKRKSASYFCKRLWCHTRWLRDGEAWFDLICQRMVWNGWVVRGGGSFIKKSVHREWQKEHISANVSICQ